MRVDHVAVWTPDLERMRRFYERLGGRAGERYHNPRTDLESCFVAFAGEVRLELMTRPGLVDADDPARPRPGYAHVALSLGSREAVDATTARLEAEGVRVLGRPRLTGDGYYESVVSDPDGNPVELTA